MKGPHWYQPGDAVLYLALRRVWELHARTVQPWFPPGVYRHRSIEEMKSLQEQWDAANFARHRERMEKAASTVEGGGPPEDPA
jgi:hypothetical protein